MKNQDVIYDEKIEHKKYIKPLHPPDLKAGEYCYVFSEGMRTWLWSQIISIDKEKFDSFYIAYKSKEHEYPNSIFYANKATWYWSVKIDANREKYFTKFPIRRTFRKSKLVKSSK